ncbi:hypothetical protein Ancab_004900 [Ancistrocladus abbreviatus]
MLRWRKQNLEDLIEQLRHPMDGAVNPALSAWISRAITYARELNIDDLQVRIRGTCCPGINAGMVIDRKMRELEMLIANGERISEELATRGYIRQEINFICSVVKEEKDNIWKAVSERGVGTICIHGIAGVGKTAIAAAINKQALRAPEHFDFVIWVDVSNGADLQMEGSTRLFEQVGNLPRKQESLLGSGTLREMRSNGMQRLNELSDARLLENANKVGKEEKVKMINLIRDMALAIIGEIFFVKAGNRHTQFPLAGASPEGVVRMSFMRNQLAVLVLPGTYNFNMLSTTGYVWGSNEVRDWSGACVEWLPDLGHLADLQLVFLNAVVFNNYMNACPKLQMIWLILNCSNEQNQRRVTLAHHLLQMMPNRQNLCCVNSRCWMSWIVGR